MEAQSLPRPRRLFLPRNPRVLAAFSDERLVEQVRCGNEAAFEALYDRHHRSILSFCRHMLASVDEAEDAVQQTFISAYSSLRADGRDIRLKPWLYAIARNRCLSTLRSRREHPAELDDVPTAGLAEEVQQRSDLRDLLEDMRDLPVDQRAALVLSEIGDLSHGEVGAVVGCEVAKVKSLVFQARSSLIETRKAREIPCHQIREQLATASGGALRRGPLRRHLKACAGCAEFRDDVRRQRRALAAILPVVPTLGLKKSALAAVGFGGGGAAGGGLVALAGSSAAAKLATAAVVAAVGVGGGLVIDQHSRSRDAEAAGGQKPAPASAGAIPVVTSGPGALASTHPSAARRTQPATPRRSAKAPVPARGRTAHTHPVAAPHARAGGPSSRQQTRALSSGAQQHTGAPHPSSPHPQHAPPAPTAAPQPAPPAAAPLPPQSQDGGRPHAGSDHGSGGWQHVPGDGGRGGHDQVSSDHGSSGGSNYAGDGHLPGGDR